MRWIAKWVMRSSHVGGWKSNKATSTLADIICRENKLRDWWYHLGWLYFTTQTDNSWKKKKKHFLLYYLSCVGTDYIYVSPTGNRKSHLRFIETNVWLPVSDISLGSMSCTVFISACEPTDAYSGSSLRFDNKVVTMVTPLQQPVAIHLAGNAV